MKIWIFNCQEVSHLVSRSMDQDVSFTQKMGIRFHLMMCKYCANFALQLKKMRELIHKDQIPSVPHVVMDNEAKREMKQCLKDRLEKRSGV